MPTATMTILLEDLVEERSASNRRAADRLDAEVRRLSEERRQQMAFEVVIDLLGLLYSALE